MHIVAGLNKLLGHKAHAQIGLHHGQNLVGGKGLDHRLKRQMIPAEKVGVKLVRLCIGPQRNQRMAHQLGQRDPVPHKIVEFGRAHRHAAIGAQRGFDQLGRVGRGRGGHG